MLDEIEEVFKKMTLNTVWSINLVKIKQSKKNGINYIAIEIPEFDKEGIYKIVKEISGIYTNGGNLKEYEGIEKYDGTSVENVIYELETSNQLINEEYSKLIDSLAKPNKEIKPLELKYDCYILKGSIEIDNIDYPVKLVFMHNPIKVLKNKFIKIGSEFKEITDKVIALDTKVDIMFFKDKVYFLNHNGEKLFDMERTHKIICQKKLKEIKDNEIVTDFEKFSIIASHGRNPTKFLTFSNKKLDALKNPNVLLNIAQKFNIPTYNGKLDTSQKEATEKVIKILCEKGKIDPFDYEPVEVYGAKRWK